MNQTTEINRKIAEYLGYKYYSVYDAPNSDLPGKYQVGWKLHDHELDSIDMYEEGPIGERVWLATNHDSLKFHKKIKWLWSFFEKLEKDYYIYSINNNYCSIQEQKKHYLITQQRASTTFKACYNAATKFLEYKTNLVENHALLQSKV